MSNLDIKSIVSYHIEHGPDLQSRTWVFLFSTGESIEVKDEQIAEQVMRDHHHHGR